MPLMRWAKIFSLLDASVAAGYETSEIDVSKAQFKRVFVMSNVANTFRLLVNTGKGYKEIENLSVPAGGHDFFILWALPCDKIKIKVDNAATVSIEVEVMT